MTRQIITNRPSKPPKPFLSNSKFILISMASLLFLSLVSLSLFFSLSSSSTSSHRHRHRHAPPSPSSAAASTAATPLCVRLACNATRFPDACEASLTQTGRVSQHSSPPEIITSAIGVSSENLRAAQEMVRSILAASAGNINRSTAAKNCLEVLGNSDHRISMAETALARGRNKDARAWLSAALLFQYDCWSALKYANDTSAVNKMMSFLDSLTKLSSNALGMVASYDAFGNETASWRPPGTERDGVWETGSGDPGSGFETRTGFPSKLTADVTVCKGGGCDFETVQDGVNAAPNDNVGLKRFVIYIKEGVYEEVVRVGLEKSNVVFLGDGMGKTVITASLNVGQPGLSTYNTATLGVLGDGFMANCLTVQNTAGPDVHQAVAFRSDSDLSIIENCEFIGNQDTLYAHSLRQFYKSCRIQGNVDFIFGNSASVFQDCEILVSPRQVKPEKGENNAITAHGRTDPGQSTGFVFQNCLINGTEEYMRLYQSKPQVHKNFLGRPWKEYSRTVFIRCNLEALITPQGWMPWSGDFALKTLFYGEFENSGAGSDFSQRVAWSNQIPAEHVYSYSVQSFLQGDDWIPPGHEPGLNSGKMIHREDNKRL